MKFARLLRDAIPEQPDVESLFQCYKKLKKLIKRLDSAINEQESIASGGGPEGSDSDDDGRDATSGPTSATAAREEEGDGPASVGGGRAGDPARGCTVEPAEVSEGERSAAVEELPAGTSALPPSRASATGGPPRVAPMPEPLEVRTLQAIDDLLRFPCGQGRGPALPSFVAKPARVTGPSLAHLQRVGGFRV